MKATLDLRLYLVADPDFCALPIEDVVAQGIEGGVSAVQLRSKTISTSNLIGIGLKLNKICGERNIPFLVNDRPEVAIACHASGVHLGQGDLSTQEARRILGEKAIIGVSIQTQNQAIASEDLVVDYVGAGPIFPTSTKTDLAAVIGLEELEIIRKLISRPLIGIGGIHSGNAHMVFNTGVDGVAVISAICCSPDPRTAAMLFKIQRKT